MTSLLAPTGGDSALAWPDPDAIGAKLGRAPAVPADFTDIGWPENAPSSAGQVGSPSAPPIQEVAVALGNDPLAIYNYVKTEIAFEPIYGSLREPDRTIIERAGTDADQAFLLVELLRAAGLSANYLYGTVTLPLDLAASWVRVEEDASVFTTCSRVFRALANGGVPVSTSQPCGDNVTRQFVVQHVWVAANIGGGSSMSWTHR